MKWFGLILCFILICMITLILFSKIKVKIYKRGSNKGEVDIYLTFIKHIHIDIGKMIKKYIERYSVKENMIQIKNFYNVSKKNKYLIDKIMKCIIVKRVVFVPAYNTTSPLFYPYIIIANWQIIGIFKRMLSKFKSVENEYYNVMMNDDEKKGFNLELLMEVRIGSIIYILLSNIKETFKLFKSTKEGKVNGREQTFN